MHRFTVLSRRDFTCSIVIKSPAFDSTIMTMTMMINFE